MSTQGKRGGGIGICDPRFIKRGLQPIELPLGDICHVLKKCKKKKVCSDFFFFYLNSSKK
jgi:hypothetical protein